MTTTAFPPAVRNGAGPPPLPGPGRPPAPLPAPDAESGEPSLAEGLCRLTVLGDQDPDGPPGVARRADLAVPRSLTPGDLLPLLVARMTEQDLGGSSTQLWALQRLGEAPLDPDRSLEAHDLLDGEVLHLRPVDAPIPPIRYDDVPDAIVDSLTERTDRWQPAATRLLLYLVAVGSLLTAAAMATVVVAPGLLGVVGLLLAAAAVAGGLMLLRRAGGDQPGERHLPARGAALVFQWCGVGLALLAGLVGPSGAAGLLAPSPAGVLVALLAAGTAAGVCLFVGRVGAVGFGVALALVLTALALMLVWALSGWTFPVSAGVLAVVLFIIASLGPRIATRVSGLRVPELPRNAGELQNDLDPIDGDDAAVRTARADGVITAIVAGAAASTVLAVLLLRPEPGWAAPVLMLLLTLGLGLRGALLLNVAQRMICTLGALAAAALLALHMVGQWDLAWALVLWAVALLGWVGALLAAWRLSGRRLLPIWGRIVEIAQMLTAIGMVPVLLQLLGVYGWLRGLNG